MCLPMTASNRQQCGVLYGSVCFPTSVPIDSVLPTNPIAILRTMYSSDKGSSLTPAVTCRADPPG